MYVSCGGEVLDASGLFQCACVHCEYYVGIVYHNPAFAVVDSHGLGHIAEPVSVGTVKQLVFYGIGRGVIVRQCGISILVVAFVGDKQAMRWYGEFLFFTIIPFHT